ncbi:MAG TPA: hypothetical protein VNK24_10820 [Elusimicrobiota bacterium]|nr:hypothetical protein [Elusimicrobiota bacterium]
MPRSSRAWLFWGAALFCAACAGEALPPGLLRPVQRGILNVSLGESRRRAAADYPGLKACPSQSELSGRVARFELGAKCVKNLPKGVEEMWLGFDDPRGLLGGRLAEIQVVYDAAFTQQKPADALAGDVSLIYGPPRRTEGKFWWADQDTVMRVFYAEIPGGAADSGAVSLRTSFQLVDASLFRK